MGSLSIWHWLVVLAIILVLFGGGKGAGRISSMMGDLGKGFRSFKQNLAEDDSKKPQDASMANSSLNAPLPEPNKTSSTVNQG